MPEWLHVTLGLLASLAVLASVFAVAGFPRTRREKPSRLATPTGRSDEEGWSGNTIGWTSNPRSISKNDFYISAFQSSRR